MNKLNLYAKSNILVLGAIVYEQGLVAFRENALHWDKREKLVQMQSWNYYFFICICNWTGSLAPFIIWLLWNLEPQRLYQQTSQFFSLTGYCTNKANVSNLLAVDSNKIIK